MRTDPKYTTEPVFGVVGAMSEYTPGPWVSPVFHGTDENNAEAIKLGLKPVQALSNDGSRFVMADDKRVALVDCQAYYKRGRGHQIDCAERDANAALIASAPYLVDGINALLGLLQLICARDDIPSDIKLSIESSHRVDEARMALKKAGVA